MQKSESDNAEKYQIIKEKVNELRLKIIFEEFLKVGLKPLLIKGWVTARKYPKPFERQYVDYDLVFHPNEFEQAQKIYETGHFNFMIDFHNSFRHLDSLSFETIYNRSEVKIIENSEVRFPCEEDHLRIICVHWLNDGGENKDRLWDIYHAVNNRKPEFDWDLLFDGINKKRRGWIICAIGAAKKYLGLNLEGTPIDDETNDLPKWFIKFLEKQWATGVNLIPLHQAFGNNKIFWQQLKKRFPPNPIQATIEVDGYFEKYPRIFYQILDIIKRASPSIERMKLRLR